VALHGGSKVRNHQNFSSLYLMLLLLLHVVV
jgi:hypothetical protein